MNKYTPVFNLTAHRILWNFLKGKPFMHIHEGMQGILDAHLITYEDYLEGNGARFPCNYAFKVATIREGEHIDSICAYCPFKAGRIKTKIFYSDGIRYTDMQYRQLRCLNGLYKSYLDTFTEFENVRYGERTRMNFIMPDNNNHYFKMMYPDCGGYNRITKNNHIYASLISLHRQICSIMANLEVADDVICK